MRKLISYAGKPLCLLLLVSFVLLDLSVSMHSAQAGLIGTETVINVQATGDARARVAAFLEREDVQQAMINQGVNPAEARSRVAALTEEEVLQIAGELDRLPAGAGVGSIIGAVVLIFLVLLITDILGFTKVFPFTRSAR